MKEQLKWDTTPSSIKYHNGITPQSQHENTLHVESHGIVIAKGYITHNIQHYTIL